MKKVLALVLTFALVFSTLGMAFAEDTTTTTATLTDAQVCEQIGMLKGDGTGVTAAYLATTPKRIQSAIMFLRLKGLEAEALAFTGTANFADADKAAWAKPAMAYLKAHPELGWAGNPDGTFGPNDNLTTQQYYKVMLEALGYKQNTAEVVGDFAWADVVAFAASKGLTKVATVANFTVNDMAVATVEGLKATVKGGTLTLASSLVASGKLDSAKAIAAGVVAAVPSVASVTATSPKAFLVKFSGVVTDTSKVTTDVKRNGAAVALTPTWNTEKTELTLSSAANLVQDTYTIVVKADSKEVSNSTVKIEAQKVAKIEFLSDTIVRANDWEGYVPVKITDQYGTDVTKTALCSNITWTSSGDAVSKALKSDKVYIRKGTVNTYTTSDLKAMPSMVINAYEQTAQVFASATLKVSTAIGGVAEIKLNGLVDASGNAAKIVDGAAQALYLQYTATDAFGNTVTDYTTLNNTNVIRFYSSWSAAAAITVEKDPADNTKAVLKIQPGSGVVTYDTPIVFTATAITSGKSAQFSTTAYKAAKVATFTLLAPELVAGGETVEIPYTAFDQNGTALTEYAKLDQTTEVNITASGGSITRAKSATGNLVLKWVAPANNGTTDTQYTITSTVADTGKFSMLTLNLKPIAVPKTLKAVSAAYPAMVSGATQDFDFYNEGNIVVLDQYDREYDMLNDSGNYKVALQSDNDAVIADGDGVGETDVVKNATSVAGGLGSAATMTAGGTEGTATITVTLFNDANTNNVIDANETLDDTTFTLMNVGKDDIQEYAVKSVATLFDVNEDTAFFKGKAAESKMHESLTPYGKLAGGTAVKLATADILNRTTNDPRFKIGTDNKVYADTLGTGVSEATAKAFVSVLGYNGIVYTPSVDLKATKTAVQATDVAVSVDFLSPITTATVNAASISGDTITIDDVAFTALAADGLFKYTAAGVANGYTNLALAANKGGFVVEVTDNYGNVGTIPSKVVFTQYEDAGSTTITAATNITVDTNGVATISGNLNAGDKFVMTIMTKNGLTTAYNVVIN